MSYKPDPIAFPDGWSDRAINPRFWSNKKMPQTPQIVTFGYGNRCKHEPLFDAIARYGIRHVIDVRRSPRAWSLIWYGSEINMACRRQGIAYSHMPALGNLSGNAIWVPPDEIAAEAALDEVADLAHRAPILLLCAELDYRRCHRTEVARQVCDRIGGEIKHA